MILSGGAGTRLWPLSTRESPKQFLELLGEPLFEATLDRLDGLAGVGKPTVVAGRDQLAVVEKGLANKQIEATAIVVEPAGRNTAPAVVAAALVSAPDDVLVVLPSDHVIADRVAFAEAVASAVEHARDGALVTFGIEPTRAETGYGYIKKGEPVGDGFRVERFKEKPGADEAKELIADGGHLWNSGMFVFTAGSILEEATAHAPDVLEGVKAALPADRTGRIELGEGFARVPSISIDHAVMEKADKTTVIPLDAGWSDLGSWQSVWEMSERDEAGNILIGDVIAMGVSDSYVRSGSRTIAIAGVEGLVVVETPQVVLIIPKEKSQTVRDLAARSEGRPGD